MPTFVPVHPAWFGGWCWKKIVPQLHSAGHAVYAPTLTGLGERAHLANPEVSLSTNIEDVVNVVVFEDLDAVTLVGTSSRGTVITGIADRVPERIERVVYLDAFLPSHGQSTWELIPPDRRSAMEQLVESEGDGWLLPRFSPAPWETFVRNAWRVTGEEDLQWVLARLRATPFRHFTEPIQLRQSNVRRPRPVYIRCRNNPGNTHFDRNAATAQSSSEWTYRELMTPHLPYITHADELTEVLLEVTA